jgi:hypothetical protein
MHLQFNFKNITGLSKMKIIYSFFAALTLLPAALLHAQPFSNANESVADYANGTITPTSNCAELTEIDLPEIVEISSRMVPAAGNIPAHCNVQGLLEPEIAFRVNLPAIWNGRFYMVGNGGHAGSLPLDNSSLEYHFVTASTNTGHNSNEEPGATFVLSDPQKAIDYAYRAVHVTAVTAKGIANAYYGQPVDYSYWNSCSNGGRQGMLEAQRYPNDFDGIVANAPWVHQTGFSMGAIWNQQLLSQTPITADKMALVSEHVMAQCDLVDGLEDGLIDNPRNCSFTVASDIPSCPAGVDNNSCLTPDQADTIQKIYDGPRTSQGQQIFPGFELGSEQVVQGTSSWMNLIVPGTPGGDSADFGLGNGTLQYLAFQPPQPNYDYRDFDFDTDTEVLERWSRLADALDTDLSVLRERGGKVIMTYGWADTILQPMMGVNYYEQAVAANSPNAEEFIRLFMVPGMTHCAGGLGPDQNDAVTAVIDWVEEGIAPDQLIARKIVDGETTRSRPLCPYPQVARYSGQGSIDDAANFSCEAP